MLQGNPFETERWMQERTQTVQQQMMRVAQPGVSRPQRELRARWLPQTYHVRLRVRTWWLPVAFGLGTLLGLAVAG
jgi:hypothetical protein